MQPKKKQGRIIGVLRSPTNLYQLIFQEPIGGKAQPLLTKALSPHEAPQLYAAWERLSCADLEDPELPQALLLVLESTLPMRGFDWRRQLPAETKTKEPPRPTAANPRAYRGTKRQPPKETEAERLDLRAYLGAWRVEQQWLSKLGLPSVDPYFKKNFSQHDANRDIYSEEFISCFLPCLQAAGAFYLVGFLWSSVISLKTLFGESWDDALPGLLLLLLGEGVAAFDNFLWVGFLPSFGARCHEALREIIRTQAYRASPFWVKPEEIFRFLSSTPERHFAVRLEALLRGVINKAHFAYLESGFLIADHFNEAFKFEEIPAGREAVSLSISRLLSGAEKDFSADGGAGFWALYIWRCCGQLVGLQERLQQLLSSSVRGRPLYLAVRFLCSFSPAQEWEERWRFLYQNIPQMIALLESIEPTYQEKFLLDVNSWFWGLAEEDLPLWSSGLSLLAQRACPPFSTGSHGAYVMLGLCLFIYAKEKSLRRAELIPPKHWKTLEKSCLDNNASTLIDLGLRALCFTDLEFSLRALQTCPGALLEASRWLGMV